MKRKKKHLVAAGMVFATLAALGFLSLFIRSPHLVLTNATSGQFLYLAPLDEGEIFSIHYIHSLNQSPVREIYELRYGQIMLTAIEFETFGAGMPTELEPGQTLTHLEAGGMRIDGYERLIPDLRYLIGHTAELTLHIADREIPLAMLDEPGQSVQFSPRQLNLWQLLYFTR